MTETAAQIAERISEAGAMLRLCSFAQFCRPDIIEQLQARGLWAVETNWRDLQFAAAFRNLRAVAAAKLVRLTGAPQAPRRSHGANHAQRPVRHAQKRRAAIAHHEEA